MTAALAAVVDTLDLPTEPGVSVRTCRAVLRTLARIANSEGEFRYGFCVSKLAQLCELSDTTVKRAQRYLIRHGLIERAAVGGGRASTRWRILVEALTARPTSPTAPRARPAGPPSARPITSDRTADHPVPHGRGLGLRHGLPRVIRAAAASVVGRSGMSPPVENLCEHGHDATTLPSGQPRCPVCRRRTERRDLAPPPSRPRRKTS